MARRALAALLAIYLAACARDDYSHLQPHFWGHDDALSAADREAILALAQSRVAVIAPGAQVENVKVFDSRQVNATFVYEPDGPAGYLYMEKMKRKWRVTVENNPPK